MEYKDHFKEQRLSQKNFLKLGGRMDSLLPGLEVLLKIPVS